MKKILLLCAAGVFALSASGCVPFSGVVYEEPYYGPYYDDGGDFGSFDFGGHGHRGGGGHSGGGGGHRHH